MEILSLRPVPAAGLFLSLTRRCPLSCAHCSTNSTLSSEEHAEDIFRRFVETFTPANRPELILLTGGEALLRPRLVRDLTERAHAVGARVCLGSGMFFARQAEVPSLIGQAIAGVDHFIASLDVFHEREVARSAVFRVVRAMVDRGQDASFHAVGRGADDPYLADVTSDVRRYFGDRVPMLVATVSPVGRAKAWLNEQDQPLPANLPPSPCVMAAWPVMGPDGTLVGCDNQVVVDGPAPAHLRLGHAAVDDWPTVRERYLTSTMIRAIRVFGPVYAAERYGSGKVTCDGYCATCYKLSDDPEIRERLEPVMARPTMAFIEQQAAALPAERFVALHGHPTYAHLASLGYGPA